MDQDLKAKLTDRLLRYSATASLLAGGLLATTASHPALAGGVITNVYGSEGDLELGESLLIDIDNGGTAELSLQVHSAGMSAYVLTSSLSVAGIGGGFIATAYALPFLYPIDSSANMVVASDYLRLAAAGGGGFWDNLDGSEPKYIGVFFPADIGTMTPPLDLHYGWIEITYTDSNQPGGPHAIVTRTGIDTPAGDGVGASVDLASAQAASGLQAVTAGAFAALGGTLTWLRNKLRR